MTFLTIVIVFLIVQFYGPVESIQSDGWYKEWAAKCRNWFQGERLQLAAQLLVPMLGLWLVLDLAADISSLLLLLLVVPLLLYSLGRGDFTEWVQGYLEAARRNDNEVAADYAQRLGVDISETSDWPSLHQKVLQRAGYRGFERWFGVIFWFVILGPIGAVFYRLTSLSAHNGENSAVMRHLFQRLLWILEWPAVRLLGMSLALIGNFSSCASHCVESLLDTQSSSDEVLEHFIHGAMNLNTSELTAETVTEKDIEALPPLFSRSLVLWVCVLAIIIIV